MAYYLNNPNKTRDLFLEFDRISKSIKVISTIVQNNGIILTQLDVNDYTKHYEQLIQDLKNVDIELMNLIRKSQISDEEAEKISNGN